MSQHTHTSWASTSAMGTSRAGGETSTRSRSPAATTGQGSWRLPEERCLPSCPASRVCCVQQPGYTAVKSYSKHWPCLFPQHGPGRKHHRKIGLDQWQFIIVQKYPGELASGLFHSDGWRGVNRVRRRLADGDRWYEYPRYLFSNESKDILRLCGQTLDQLGVAWRFSRRNAVSYTHLTLPTNREV